MRRRKRDEHGNLGPFESVFDNELSPDEKIEQLEAINAKLAYESLQKDMKLEELNTNQAELTYQLMMKGVL